MLRVDNPVRESRAFGDIKARLRGMAPAPTTEEATRRGGNGRRTSPGRYPSDSQIGAVQPPSSRYRTYDEGSQFSVSVPSNWRELPENSSVKFSPEGGYGNYRGQSVFTHGVEICIDRHESHNLRRATEELIDGLTQSNPRLRQSADYSTMTVDGYRGLRTTLSNVSDATGQPERIALYTAQLSDGSLFYLIGVAPAGAFNAYQPVFNRIVGSLQFSGYRNSRY